ncbi:helix-turn-helix domain-containing protein [Demetria terragena]|uniref:helix-turn-helix domain-containing protein n=1 Tax=Demetria terragena TaxID=63959 RepID=UPI000362C9F0|nr:helix-turn-helix domain-containing protein [Demetria terragena]
MSRHVVELTDDAPPWAALPRDVSDAMKPHMSEVVGAIIEVIQRDVPAYARPLEGDFGVAVRRGVEVALSRLLLELPGSTEPALPPHARQVYVGLGKGEARTGRPMEVLLAAYRIGARVAFRAVSRIAVEEGLDPTVLMPLGESIFAYMDELTTASIEAFTAEQFRRAGERDRRRAQLVEQLVSGRADEADLRQLATEAGWPIPAEVVVAVLPTERADGLRLALGETGLVRGRPDQVVMVAPAPTSGRARRRLEHALADRRAWIGPARPWLRAAASLRAAHAAMTMPDPASVHQAEGEGPWWVRDHLSTLVLGHEPELVADLAAQCLAPLDGLRPGQRARLAKTLLSWLGHQGERSKVAAELHIHPQTVGYRVGQLRELFGAALDDPTSRFELQIVLRAGHA